MDQNNKRILKNTLFLYTRMILILVVNLITYRLILQVLGVEDYGIYQVVGGIVLLFTILNGALSSGSSRFITFSLGKEDCQDLKNTFSVSFTIHLAMAVVIFLLLETIGLWYINTHLVVPEERMVAVNWIYQFSVLSCMLSLTQVPYSSLIIAHERMDIYAFVGVAEVIFKLVLVGTLFFIGNTDKLIMYGLLICLWSFALQGYYRYFCFRKYPESHLILVKDKVYYKSMISFSFWDMIGCFTVQGNTQGVNLMINAFFGVVYNAAFGLANQIRGILSQFSDNFMTAVIPQITKKYAERDFKRVNSLVFNASKMGFLLYAIIAVPVYFEVEYLLRLWLTEVPDKTPLFLQLTILYCLIRSFARPVVSAIHASGYIKWLNILSGGFAVLTTLPLTYALYVMGFVIETTFWVSIVNSAICNGIELWCLRKVDSSFCVTGYIRNVYIPCVILAIIVFAILYTLVMYLESSFIRLIIVGVVSTISIVAMAYLFILSKGQKEAIRMKVATTISKYKQLLVLTKK